MSAENDASDAFKFKIQEEEDLTILEASGVLEEKHPKIIVSGLTKLATDGKKAVVLELSGAKELPIKYLAELANGCQAVKNAGGRVVMVGLPEQSAQLISSSKASKWVGVITDLEGAREYFNQPEEEQDEDFLTGEELEKTLEALRQEVSQIDLNAGRELRRKNAFLKQRLDEMKELVKSWQPNMPGPGDLPEADSFFRAESSLLRLAAQRELIPMETFKELLHRWTELTGEEVDLEEDMDL
jgi:anti-anti-sigma regulatory factor